MDQINQVIPRKTICLFDVDGTLTKPRNKITPDMDSFLDKLSEKMDIGIVGGSDLIKIQEQMGSREITTRFPTVFAENGIIAYVGGILQKTETIQSYMGEDKLQTLINFCLEYMSKLRLPCKRGNFIEFRTGLINVSPVGRSCSQSERDAFSEYDAQHKIREQFVSVLKEKFSEEYGLTFSIGGQISIDIFPQGWDKTFCLRFLKEYDQIYFFGDKTLPGGNDYEIFSDTRTIGYSVSNPEDTKRILTDLFF